MRIRKEEQAMEKKGESALQKTSEVSSFEAYVTDSPLAIGSAQR